MMSASRHKPDRGDASANAGSHNRASSANTAAATTNRRRRLAAKLLIVPIAAAYVWLAFAALERGNSLLIGIVLVALSMIPFLLRFERAERKARELVLIAVMAAVASVSRVPFATLLPSFTPVTFIVIVSGIVFGAEAGWMVGAASALVSNFFLGQGPWTPWQMFAWGMAGYTAGLFAHRSAWRRRRIPLALFGLMWGFLFGWIMNATLALDQWMQTRSWEAVAAKYALSLPFEMIHASANVFFLTVFGPSWIKMLERYRRKYGTLQRLTTDDADTYARTDASEKPDQHAALMHAAPEKPGQPGAAGSFQPAAPELSDHKEEIRDEQTSIADRSGIDSRIGRA